MSRGRAREVLVSAAMTKKWILCLGLLLPVFARAESIQEKRNRANAENAVASSAKSTNNSCKLSLPTASIIDWDSWKTAVDGSNHYVSAQCGAVLYGISNSCSDKIARDTIEKDIKRVVCLGGASGDLIGYFKDSVLYIRTSFTETSVSSKTKAWLLKHLP